MCWKQHSVVCDEGPLLDSHADKMPIDECKTQTNHRYTIRPAMQLLIGNLREGLCISVHLHDIGNNH